MTKSEEAEKQPPFANAPCFIERQFPVAKISMESYRERKAVAGQTLTGVGKWWGRKPLVLVRATLLGLLMPASEDPEKDREIFLKLLTMDREGLKRRKSKPIPEVRLIEEFLRMPRSIQKQYLESETTAEKPKLRRLDRSEKQELQRLVFERLTYAEKLEYCLRPEQIDGPSPEAWNEINNHLGTQANNLQELVEELGIRRFGHRPRVGDAFCGGGSVPFEAARLGCDAYGSDINPVAALLTWASLNMVSGGEDVAQLVENAQREIFKEVDQQITEWGIEHNSLGWRADAYLYCVEVVDPESGWKVPLLPSLVIAPKNSVISRLVPDEKNKRYDIEILENVSQAEWEMAENSGTVKDSRLVPPDGSPSTPIKALRRGMRMWEKDDIVPRSEDVFQERLYCIRWVETYIDEKGKEHSRRHYRAPITEDLQRERRVLELLHERFAEWQEKGFLPSRQIEPGDETARLQRERGWTYWHNLFTPRQLLIKGLVANYVGSSNLFLSITVVLLMFRYANWDSRLCRWLPTQSGGAGGGKDTYFNNALNTLYNYSSRGLIGLESSYVKFKPEVFSPGQASLCDARVVEWPASIWITDPPYADAVRYDELSEFFLAWCDKSIPVIFPDWYTDSKRALSVRGDNEAFRQVMVQCYKQLTSMTPSNGLQVVMFTHQDARVWADLTMILWSSGLRVTAAWTIATETEADYKEGNYVKATVLLILRKRKDLEPVFLDEISNKVEAEVKLQLDSMLALEDDSDPNFGDADYQLAAYAAALRVLTAQPIEEINPEKEILRERQTGEISPVEQLIRNAVKIACDHLVPRELDGEVWKHLEPMERFYLKSLEVESHGEYRAGVYQELARGYGATDYKSLLESGKANETRLKSASEFGRKNLSGEGFGGSLVRQCLFTVWLNVKNEDTREGMNWLHTELKDYWGSREKIIHILEYLAGLGVAAPMAHWKKDAYAAGLLAGAVRNDHI